MRKVVYNACFGGFSLSPQALLLLWERGMKEIGTHVDEYYPPAEREESKRKWPTISYDHAIKQWREFKKTLKRKAKKGDSLTSRGMFITVFSPDEQYVLSGGRYVPRDHPEVIRVVEELGERADGACAKLAIAEIPDDAQWHIDEYDGNEHVAENHRTWR